MEEFEVKGDEVWEKCDCDKDAEEYREFIKTKP